VLWMAVVLPRRRNAPRIALCGACITWRTKREAVRLELPIEQAESLSMTLPQLLACALRQRAGDQDARYVFGLGEWAIEGAKGQDCLIATLKTPDGFEVCFGIPFEACRSLGWNLLRAAETHDLEEQVMADCRLTPN
jgi:hypothetical protein